MAIESKFYDGPNTEIDRAVSAVSGSISLYGIAGANDLMLTPHPSTPYAVNIGTGNMWGHKVWDRVTSTEVVQCAAPAQGVTRWDLIAAHRNWQPLDGGPTSLIPIQGSSSKAIPATRENQPGTVDDQPLWLVQWRGGDTQPIATVDLRCWAANGGVEARDEMVKSYLAFPGSEVRIGQATWRYAAQANNQWAWEADYGIQVDGIPAGRRPIIKQGYAFLRNPEDTSNTTNPFGDGYIYFGTPFPTAMTSFDVAAANDPRQWDATTEKFTFNHNEIYANRFRLSVRVSNKDGAVVGNRTGIRVRYTAYGY